MAYSKTQVDRAGKAFTDWVRLISDDPTRIEDQRVLEGISKALPVVEWWRTEHSKPLSRVAANLRYYAAKQGEPVVAQRLKRVPTIAGKLLRESSRLTQLEDIGGVRAILPDQRAAYVVAGQLRKNWTIKRFRTTWPSRNLTATELFTSSTVIVVAWSRSSCERPGKTDGQTWSRTSLIWCRV